MNIKPLAVSIVLTLPVIASAVVPNPNFTAAAFFSDKGYAGNDYIAIPSKYFENGTLVMKPSNEPNATPINQYRDWPLAFQLQPSSIYFDPTSDKFPSFSERNTQRRQCVAFAKAVSGVSATTDHWFPASNIIPSQRYVNNDVSLYNVGQMIAYFNASSDPNKNYASTHNLVKPKNPNHVAIFLRYQYDRSTFPATITGIWVVDENWGNDGKIKKHMIPISTGPLVGNALNYYIVDVR